MTILAIETSCDETAIALLDAEGDVDDATFTIRGNALFSQVELHQAYGGVYPNIAKREHAKNLVPILQAALSEAGELHDNHKELSSDIKEKIGAILEREPEMAMSLISFLEEHDRPEIDYIAVTNGPGLEPALWVGVTFAQALSDAWNIPLLPVNHMEGHILSALAVPDENHPQKLSIQNTAFPVMALLISGGHTELVLMQEWLSYLLVGQTRDDAVGEAFDKVARMLELPYPGGPEISKQAECAREKGIIPLGNLPRPMLESDTYDFSFSGLKTAVRYALADTTLTPDVREKTALEFETAVTEVLLKKTARAMIDHDAQTLVLGGGVSANAHIRKTFEEYFSRELTDRTLRLPHPKLTTDNAVMIGLAGFYQAHSGDSATTIVANGNLSLHGT